MQTGLAKKIQSDFVSVADGVSGLAVELVNADFSALGNR